MRFCFSEIDSTVLATADGSASTAAPVITVTPARNLLTSLLRHRRADLGTLQVEPHWTQVLVCSRGCHGNRMR
jgi:hypothetical protein